MGKFDYRQLPSSKRRDLMDQVAEILTTIKTKDEMRQFLQRLLTPSEYIMLARRLAVAQKLTQGHSYTKIREELKVGMSTIQSVNQWLEYAVGDYATAKARQSKKRPKNVRDHWSTPGSFDDVRHRYSSKFLLLNLLLDL